jgi:hypothetical protein
MRENKKKSHVLVSAASLLLEYRKCVFGYFINHVTAYLHFYVLTMRHQITSTPSCRPGATFG